MSGQLENFWIFGLSFKYKIDTINYPTLVDIDNFNQ